MIIQKSAFHAAEAGVEISIHFRKNLGVGFFGGEGLFNTVLTGPGRVWLQTMPICNVAVFIRPYIPTGNG